MLDFLSKITVDDTVDKKPRSGGGKRKQVTPEGLAIRIFRDGSLYPSQELIAKFSLEYSAKDTEVVGFGFDVVDTDLFPKFGTPQRLVIISPVSKSAPKVDLFGTTNYITDPEEGVVGSPTASVATQGSKTFGADSLIPLLEEVYGLKFYKPATETEAEVEGADFYDLSLVANPSTDQPWSFSVAHVPKKVSRGKDKGSVTTIRRENVSFYVLYPATKPDTAENDADQKEEVTTEKSEVTA